MWIKDTFKSKLLFLSNYVQYLISKELKMSHHFQGHHHQLPLFMDFSNRPRDNRDFCVPCTMAGCPVSVLGYKYSWLLVAAACGGRQGGPATHATCTLITICQDPRCRARATRRASRRSTSLSERGNYWKMGGPRSLWPPDPVSRTDGTQRRGAAQAPGSPPHGVIQKLSVISSDLKLLWCLPKLDEILLLT